MSDVDGSPLLSRRDILKLGLSFVGGTALAAWAPKLAGALSVVGGRSLSETISSVLDHDVYISNNPDIQFAVFRHKFLGDIAIVTTEEMDNDLGLHIIRSEINISGRVGKDQNGRPAIIAIGVESLRRNDGDSFHRQNRVGAFANLDGVFNESDSSELVPGYAVLNLDVPTLTLFEEKLTTNQETRQVRVPLQKVYFDRRVPQGVASEPPDPRALYALVAEEQLFDFGIEAVATVPIVGKYMGVDFSINMVTGAGLGVKQISLAPKAAMDLMAKSFFRAVWANGVNYGASGKPFPTGTKYNSEYVTFMNRLSVAQKSIDQLTRAQCDFKVKTTNPLTGGKETIVMRPMIDGDIVEGVVGLKQSTISVVNYSRTRYLSPNSNDGVGYGCVSDNANGVLDLRFAISPAFADSKEAVSNSLSLTPTLLTTGKVPDKGINRELRDDILSQLQIIK